MLNKKQIEYLDKLYAMIKNDDYEHCYDDSWEIIEFLLDVIELETSWIKKTNE